MGETVKRSNNKTWRFCFATLSSVCLSLSLSLIAECAEQRVAWDVHQALGPVRNQQALRVCVCVFLR